MLAWLFCCIYFELSNPIYIEPALTIMKPIVIELNKEAFTKFTQVL